MDSLPHSVIYAITRQLFLTLYFRSVNTADCAAEIKKARLVNMTCTGAQTWLRTSVNGNDEPTILGIFEKKKCFIFTT